MNPADRTVVPSPGRPVPARTARGGRRGGLARRLALVAALTGLLAGIAIGVPGASPTAAAAAPTIVSLTFDDGNADQLAALPVLSRYGMHGTFYVISGSVGAPGYLTRADLATIAADGHEIGGHTVSHPDLTGVPADEAARQICDDRVTLAGWGFRPTSFAYPYAAYTTATEAAVAGCGYNSARALGDLASAHGCTGCDLASPVPPPDPYALEAVDEIDTSWTLAQLEQVVTRAEVAGGWVPFTFHHLCAGCDSLSISPATFADFLAWLALRPATTTVRTVDQVVGGTYRTPVPGPPASGSTAVVNASLETAGAPDFPQCWFPGGYGTNTATWTRTTDAHSGGFAERLDLTGYGSGDAKLLPVFDLGSCSPAVTAGHTYRVTASYRSTAVTQFAAYYRDAAGAWFYWTSSPWFAASSAWSGADWTTPPVPAGATGLSFGLNLFTDGSLTTDDYAIADTAASAPAPARVAAALAPSAASSAVTPVSRPGASGRHAHRRAWDRHARPFLPGRLRPGQRVAIPVLPD